MRRASFLMVALLLPLCCVAAQSQRADRSVIAGIVLQTGTDAPLFKVTVQLTPTSFVPGQPAKSLPVATTDVRGRFLLPDVDPGEYRLEFAANGYVAQQYGQRVFPGSGTPIKVVAGQALESLVVRMTPTGTVSGRILDRNGQPLGDVSVQLMRQQYRFDGVDYSAVLSRDRHTRTNDRGEYRLFFVTPARYVLTAGDPPRVSDDLFKAAGNPFSAVVAYTYYPGVLESASARALNVRSGEELSGIDMIVNLPRTYTIRGRVIDSRTGVPPATVSLSLETQSNESAGTPISYSARTGAFEFRDVPEGQYALVAGIASGPTFPRPFAEVAGFVRVNLTGSNLEGLVLTLQSGVPLSGRIRAESVAPAGNPPEPLEVNQLRVLLMPSTDGMPAVTNRMSLQPQAKTDATGAFHFEHVWDGSYKVMVCCLPQGWYVKRARLGERDALDGPLRIAEASRDPLDIVLSSNVGSAQVIALDQNRKPVPGAQVVLVPSARDRFNLYSFQTTDAGGQATLRDIVPGDYTLIAWEAIERLSWFDAEIIRDAEGSGKKLSIAESATITTDIRVVPAQ